MIGNPIVLGGLTAQIGFAADIFLTAVGHISMFSPPSFDWVELVVVLIRSVCTMERQRGVHTCHVPPQSADI